MGLPLTLAARAGHEAIVRFIIEKGASPDMIDPERLTLLSVAAIHGHVSLTRTLLALGARQDINLLPSRRPLSLASCWGHKEVAATLLSDLENHYDNEALDSQVKGALFEAIKKHHKEIIQLLISHVADLNFFSYGSGQPLNAAAKNGDTDILLLLIKHGADPNTVLDRRTGHAALTTAVLHSQEEAALILVQLTERLQCARALSFAVQKKDKPMCESLLKNGAAPEFNLSDLAGQSPEDDMTHFWVQPIVYAVQRLEIRLVQMLLDHGADVNVKCPRWPKGPDNAEYSHVLFSPVEIQHEKMVDFLLERGADPNVVDLYDRPPLTYAIECGNEYIIKSLLDHGANPYRAVDCTGKRVLSCWEISTSIRTMVEEAEKNWPGEH
jgi:ankyrin repeat protein